LQVAYILITIKAL